MSENKPDYYNNLDKTYHKIWKLLEIGLSNRNDPFHLPAFICSNQNSVSGKIVVLRGVNKENKNLWFHTDVRSNKIKILKKNPSASFLFYNKSEKVQLRVSVNIIINYKNNFTNQSWKKTAHMSRQCYLGEISPGTEALEPTSGLTDDIDNSKYTIEESEVGYKNFCIIEGKIKSIEWLYLASKGHRRAIFILNKDNIDKKWLIP